MPTREKYVSQLTGTAPNELIVESGETVSAGTSLDLMPKTLGKAVALENGETVQEYVNGMNPNSIKNSIRDDLTEDILEAVAREYSINVDYPISTPPITIDHAAKGFNTSFETNSYSLKANDPSTITGFLLTIKELNITEKLIAATDNAATIDFDVPADIQYSKLTIELMAIDSDFHRSKKNVKQIEISSGKVMAPTLIKPLVNEVVSPVGGLTLSTKDFRTIGTDTHESSSWKVTTDINGTESVLNESASSDLVSHNFTTVDIEGVLESNTDYYAFAQHSGTTFGNSAWSYPVKFQIRDGVLTKNDRFIYRHPSDRGIVIEWKLGNQPRKLFVYDEMAYNLPMLSTNSNTSYKDLIGSVFDYLPSSSSNSRNIYIFTPFYWVNAPTVFNKTLDSYYSNYIIYFLGYSENIAGKSNSYLVNNGADSRYDSSSHGSQTIYYGNLAGGHTTALSVNIDNYKTSSRLLCNRWKTLNSSNHTPLVNYARSITNINGIDNLDIPSLRETIVILTETGTLAKNKQLLKGDLAKLVSENEPGLFFENITNSSDIKHLVTSNTVLYISGETFYHLLASFYMGDNTRAVFRSYNEGKNITYNYSSTISFLVRDITDYKEEVSSDDNIDEITEETSNPITINTVTLSTPNIPINLVYVGNEVSFETSAECISDENTKIKSFTLSVYGEDVTVEAVNNKATITFTVPADYEGSEITLYLQATDENGFQSRIASKTVTCLKGVKTPTIIEPKNNAIIDGNDLLVRTDDFTSTSEDTHQYTNWLLASDSLGVNTVITHPASSDLLEHTFSNKELKEAGITQDTDYYLFAAHVGQNLKSSQWSYPVKVHTRTNCTVTDNGRIIYRHESDEGWIVEWKIGNKKKKTFVYDTVLTGLNFCSLGFNANQFAVITSKAPFKVIYHNIAVRGITTSAIADNGADKQFNNFALPTSRTMNNWWLQQTYIFPVIEAARAITVEGIGTLDVADSQELQMLLTEPDLVPDTTVSYASCTPTETLNTQIDMYTRAAATFTRGGVNMNATTGYRFILVRDLETIIDELEYSSNDLLEVQASTPINTTIEAATLVTTPVIPLTECTLDVQASFETYANSTAINATDIDKFILTVLGTTYEFIANTTIPENAVDGYIPKTTITFTIPASYQEFQVPIYLQAVDINGYQSKVATKVINVKKGEVQAPTILYPRENDVINYTTGLKIQTDSFLASTTDTHKYSNYKITTDIAGEQVFLEEPNSSDLTSHNFSLKSLLVNNFDSTRDYYLFASHVGNNLGDSKWSKPVKIRPRAGLITPNGHYIEEHSSGKGWIVEYTVSGVLKRMFVYNDLITGLLWCNTTFNTNGHTMAPYSSQATYHNQNIRGIYNAANVYENGSDAKRPVYTNQSSRTICNWWLSLNYHFPVIEAARAINVEGIGDLDIPNIEQLHVILSEAILSPNAYVSASEYYRYGMCHPTNNASNANMYYYNINATNWVGAEVAMNAAAWMYYIPVRDLSSILENNITNESTVNISNTTSSTIVVNTHNVTAPTISLDEITINLATACTVATTPIDNENPINAKQFVYNIFNTDYTVNASNNAATFNITVPLTYKEDTVTLKVYAIDTTNKRSNVSSKVLSIKHGQVNAPTVNTPSTDEVVLYQNGITIKTDAFLSTITEAHQYTSYKICSDQAGRNVVIQENLSTDLLSHTFPFHLLYKTSIAKNTTYYAFAAHYGQNSEFSAWSAPVRFKTHSSNGTLSNNGRFIYRHSSNNGYVIEWILNGELKHLFVYDTLCSGKALCATAFNNKTYAYSSAKTIYYNVTPRGVINTENRIGNGHDNQYVFFNLPVSRVCNNWWLNTGYSCPAIEYARSINVSGVGNLDICTMQELQMILNEPTVVSDVTLKYGSCTPSTGNDTNIEYYNPNGTYYARAVVASTAATITADANDLYFFMVRDLDYVEE